MVGVPVTDGRVRQLRGLDGFRRLLAVRLASQFGDGLFAAGLTWLVLLSPERRQSPEEVAIAAAVLLLPFSIVGPFTGVFLDRWSRRQVLVWGQPVRIVLAVGLIAAGDRTSIVVVYVLAIASLGVNRFLLAALSAGLPHVSWRSSATTTPAPARRPHCSPPSWRSEPPACSPAGSDGIGSDPIGCRIEPAGHRSSRSW